MPHLPAHSSNRRCCAQLRLSPRPAARRGHEHFVPNADAGCRPARVGMPRVYVVPHVAGDRPAGRMPRPAG